MLSFCGIVANVLNWDIVVSKFKLQLSYYIPFQTNNLEKDMSPLILQAMVWIVSLFFYKNDFGIK